MASDVGATGILPTLPIVGRSERFAVHRIYCVGRNYAAHVREMGRDPTREAPFFFLKPADAIVDSGAVVPYPPRTQNLHHEAELVVALGHGGANVPSELSLSLVFGYAVGNDLTRRDLQLAARDAGRPWDTGKSFDACAPVGAIHPVAAVGHLSRGAIWLTVNGVRRQSADLSQLIWSVPELIAELSTLYTLAPGDLIFTGTPEGVGPLVVGDTVEVGVNGLAALTHTIGPARD